MFEHNHTHALNRFDFATLQFASQRCCVVLSNGGGKCQQCGLTRRAHTMVARERLNKQRQQTWQKERFKVCLQRLRLCRFDGCRPVCPVTRHAADPAAAEERHHLCHCAQQVRSVHSKTNHLANLSLLGRWLKPAPAMQPTQGVEDQLDWGVITLYSAATLCSKPSR